MKWLDPLVYPISKYCTCILYVKKIWIPPFQESKKLNKKITNNIVIVGIYNPDLPKPIIDLTSIAMYPQTDYYSLDDLILWMPLPLPPKLEKNNEHPVKLIRQ